MHIILERFAYLPRATLGKFELNGETIYTVEQPYKFNAPFVSAIPDGDYELIPHPSNKSTVVGGLAYAMVNPALDVYHYPADIPEEALGVARFACLFTHIGNYARSVEGCIAVGLKLGEYDTIYDNTAKKWVNGVSSSRVAVTKVLAELTGSDAKHKLTIVPTTGAVHTKRL